MALQEEKDLDFTTQLMHFRTAYLQAVARAAVDFEFRRTLTRSGDALQVLNEYFGYRCPWQLRFVVRDDIYLGPRYNAAKGVMMTVPLHGETITIRLPKKPERSEYPGMSDEDYHKIIMEALAAYYSQNSQFLQNRQSGPQNQQPSPRNPASSHPALPPLDRNVKWSSVKPIRHYDLGDASGTFISFAAVILNTMAMAWNDQAMWRALTQEQPPQWPSTQGPYPLRPSAPEILKEWFGYEYPWDIDLVIKADIGAKYVKDKDGKYKWEGLAWPELVLILPWMSGAFVERPSTPVEGARSNANRAEEEEGLRLEATQVEEVRLNVVNTTPAIMGLALYNTDGPGYPFSCS